MAEARRPPLDEPEGGGLAKKPIVVLIEDEPEIRRFLRASLAGHGYRLVRGGDGRRGTSGSQSRQPDIVVLDLGLPDIDGLEVIRRLREWTGVPIIVLSARGQEQDKIAALDAGADDYVAKPFGVGELLARLRVSLRHAERTVREVGEAVFTAGDLEVNASQRRVLVGGKEIHLTPIEYRLLATMVKHAGKVVTHRQLLREVWGPPSADQGALPPRLHGPAPPKDRGRSRAAPAPAHRARDRLPPRRRLSAAPRRGRPRGATARVGAVGEGGRRSYNRRLEDLRLTLILLLYAATLFVGATLLFVVQPMVGKMILPLLGGTPAVWSTCMVFFQAALLGGYAYAHATTAWLGIRRQTILHLALLAVPLAVLPLGVDASRLPGGEANPVLGVLVLLSLSVGLPFFVVSATAPLLQHWFTHTGHRAARDPYFLYAASNLGSMLALLSYPALIEPRLRLRDAGWLAQTRLWTLGYLLLAVLIVLCAVVAVRRSAARTAAAPDAGGMAPAPPPSAEAAERSGRAPTIGRRLYWVALAFAPSSLLLGVTTYVTTDIAALPLLWVLPLAIYLLSFIIAFGRWPPALHRVVRAATLPLALLVMFFMISHYQPRSWVTVLWHFLLLFVVSLACHGELAIGRPSPRHLTEFYLLISVGGVLGGIANALIAPLVFNSLLEYPLAMALACVLVAGARASRPARAPACCPWRCRSG